MTEGLRHLSGAKEMKPLIIEVRKSGKSGALEVFQSHEGHFAKEKQK